MKIHEKIKYLLDKKGRGSQKDLARRLNADVTYLNKWVKGTKPVPRDYLLGTAFYLDVTVDYLLDDNQEQPINKYIPLIGVASYDIPTNNFNVENKEYISVSAQIDAMHSYAVIADNNSMLPDITDGDLIICDTSKPLLDNRLVHYTFEGKSGIKRINYQDDGSIILLPDNKDYVPIIVPKEKNNHHFLRLARCVQVNKNL